MSDSTPFLDANGIHRDHPIMPKRHPIETDRLEFLGILANLGEPGSIQRQGWENLLRVHGFQAVVQATARCFRQVDRSGKVTNDQAQAVLDGNLPDGHAVQHHGTYPRRTQAAG